MSEESQINFLIRKFQEISLKHDSFVKQFESFVQSLASISEKIGNLEYSCLNLRDILKCTEENSSKNNTIYNNKTDSLISSFNYLSNNKDLIEKEMLNIKSMFEPIGNKIYIIEDSLKHLPAMSNLLDLSVKINKLEEVFGQYCTQSALTYTDTLEAHNQLKNLVSAVTSDFIQAKNKIAEHSDYIEKNPEFVSVLKEKISQGDAATCKYLDDQIATKIAAIPKPIIPNIDDAKKQMQNQLEPVSLDARNSLLRSVNNESKISILERKVEQLQLILNKLQLQGQS